MMKNRCGVTLVELVVVIAIIGGCVFALGPFVKKARERAYRARCAAHLRRISVALHKYALDHNDAFPVCVNLTELVNMLAHPNALYAEDPAILVCPNTGHRKGALGSLTGANIDYMYISGLKADSHPLAAICADKVRGDALGKDDNHGRTGVNVLYMNGDVKWFSAVPGKGWIRE